LDKYNTAYNDIINVKKIIEEKDRIYEELKKLVGKKTIYQSGIFAGAGVVFSNPMMPSVHVGYSGLVLERFMFNAFVSYPLALSFSIGIQF